MKVESVEIKHNPNAQPVSRGDYRYYAKAAVSWNGNIYRAENGSDCPEMAARAAVALAVEKIKAVIVSAVVVKTEVSF